MSPTNNVKSAWGNDSTINDTQVVNKIAIMNCSMKTTIMSIKFISEKC